MSGDQGPMPEGFGGFDFNELRKLLEQMGIRVEGEFDLPAMMEQFGKMQRSGAPVFGFTPADADPDAAWRTTITSAKHLTQEQGTDVITAETRHQVVEAERLAQSWLNAQTTFPETGLAPGTLRREEWLEETSKGWRQVVEPIIAGLAQALERSASAEDEPELNALSSMLAPMMRHSASLIYRDRLKRVLSEVASSTLTGTEIGINLMAHAKVTVLPSNVSAFTDDLELEESDMLIYLVIREAARVRLFHHVAWLNPQLMALLAHFAREIVIDFDAISSGFDPSAMESFSLEDIAALGEQVRGSFFKPASTPKQLEILGRLEVVLALIEGWVDHVTSRVATAWLPNAGQLAEVIRRRRASGGATQEVFGHLIGLELRPRLVRDAENLWAAIEHERGLVGRDAVWQHPDMLPTAKDLADPLTFGRESAGDEAMDDMDRELRKLLEGGNDPSA